MDAPTDWDCFSEQSSASGSDRPDDLRSETSTRYTAETSQSVITEEETRTALSRVVFDAHSDSTKVKPTSSSTIPPICIDNDDLLYANREFAYNHGKKRPRDKVKSGSVEIHDFMANRQPIRNNTSKERRRLAFIEEMYDLAEGEDDVTYTKLRAAVQRTKREFLLSPEWKSFCDSVEQAVRVAEPDNIVCLGIGSLFNAENQRSEAQNEDSVKKFMHELGMLMAIKELIISRREELRELSRLDDHLPGAVPDQGGRVRMVFQDPRLCDDDVALIESLGGIVVSSVGNHAVKYINHSTFVYASCLPWHVVWDVALRDTDPAVWLGSSVRWSRSRAMAEAFVEQDHEEVQKLYRISESFLNARTDKGIAAETPSLFSWRTQRLYFLDSEKPKMQMQATKQESLAKVQVHNLATRLITGFIPPHKRVAKK